MLFRGARKVLMEGGKGLALLAERMQATIEKAGQQTELIAHADALGKALQQVNAATQAAWATGMPVDALANAVPYMQAVGHTVLAWIWLDVACTSLQSQSRNATKSIAAHAGRMGATRYFYHYELPKIDAWLRVVEARDQTCADLPEEAF